MFHNMPYLHPYSQVTQQVGNTIVTSIFLEIRAPYKERALSTQSTLLLDYSKTVLYKLLHKVGLHLFCQNLNVYLTCCSSELLYCLSYSVCLFFSRKSLSLNWVNEDTQMLSSENTRWLDSPHWVDILLINANYDII